MSQEREALKLITLPVEILEHIICYLDGFSLNNLSLTCRGLRNICASLLQEKGMVLMEWEKLEHSNSWHVKENVSVFICLDIKDEACVM